MIYAEPSSGERVKTVDVAAADRQKFSLTDADVLALAPFESIAEINTAAGYTAVDVV